MEAAYEVYNMRMDGYGKDITAVKLFNELMILQDTNKNCTNVNPLFILQYILTRLENISVCERNNCFKDSDTFKFFSSRFNSSYLRSSISQKRF